MNNINQRTFVFNFNINRLFNNNAPILWLLSYCYCSPESLLFIVRKTDDTANKEDFSKILALILNIFIFIL